MKNILTRLAQEPVIELVMFTDHTILSEPVEDWPICNSLIAFYSNGFPLEKAIEYVKLRNPLVLNDLQSQYALMDRYGLCYTCKQIHYIGLHRSIHVLITLVHHVDYILVATCRYCTYA